jgi:hypothetical protein
MPELSYAEAEALLRALGGFEPLLNSGQQWYSAPELAELLKGLGLGGDRSTVLRWMKEIPATTEFEGLGWRIPREAAIIMLASKVGRRGGKATGESAS